MDEKTKTIFQPHACGRELAAKRHNLVGMFFPWRMD